ncbi:cytochrome P450 27C1 isoform X1 [Eschrichtius robustus]|uniref:cytochrome P450 27C1 isoform X1 n=1 Tax=Eschrichtius robustus TaxID=9764 RepID=UPI0035C23B8E
MQSFPLPQFSAPLTSRNVRVKGISYLCIFSFFDFSMVLQQKHTQEYGKIFKSHFGPQFVVSVADRDLVAQVLRAEGAAPQRANMGSWQEYRDLRGRSTGLISAEGEQWLKMRSVLRQRILKPKDVAIFAGEINQVIADLIKRIYFLKSQAEDGETVTNINDLFFKYSMEGVATILYESRLGCLENSVPQATMDYIEALGLMFCKFKTSMYAGAIPRWLRPLIPKPWREFCRSWDGLFKFSQIHVDNKLRDIQCQMDRGERARGGLLTYLFLSQELTREEIYANLTEMLLAGVDTTSFTLSWAVYLLARHPEVQQTVYREIVRNLGERHVPTAADVPKVPLVRALLKETLRLFPVLPGNGRVTQEDLVVGGYLIPRGLTGLFNPPTPRRPRGSSSSLQGEFLKDLNCLLCGCIDVHSRPSWPSATMPPPTRMRTSLGPRSSGLSAGCGQETCAGLTISGPSPSATGLEAASGGGLQNWRSTSS